MNEGLRPRGNEALIRAVRMEQNEIEAGFHDDFLARNLFHAHLVSDQFNADREHIRESFLKDKKGKNMGERLELALREPYLGVISIVELGVSTEPSNTGEIDGLRHEYEDLRRWMIEHGWIERELSRAESGRTIDVRGSGITNERVVIGRTRPLVSTGVSVQLKSHARHSSVNVDVSHEHDVLVKIEIAKRVVSSISTGLYKALAVRLDDERFTREDSICAIEELMQNQPQLFDPIRTEYYLHTELI